MTLGDDLAAALPELRAQAESRMRTPCVMRPVVSVEPDPLTSEDVATYGDPTYTGLCRVKNIANQASDLESGSSTATRSPRRIDIPWGSPPQAIGTVVFIDGEPMYRLTDTADGDDMTARRYPAERVS